MATKTLIIRGMTCAACSRAVERTVGRLSGVAEAGVNLATEKLTVSYDPSTVRLSDIKNAVVKAGYNAIDEEIAAYDAKNAKSDEIKSLKRRFIISLVFAIPLLTVSR